MTLIIKTIGNLLEIFSLIMRFLSGYLAKELQSTLVLDLYSRCHNVCPAFYSSRYITSKHWI